MIESRAHRPATIDGRSRPARGRITFRARCGVAPMSREADAIESSVDPGAEKHEVALGNRRLFFLELNLMEPGRLHQQLRVQEVSVPGRLARALDQQRATRIQSYSNTLA